MVVSCRMNSPGIENGWAAEKSQGGVVLGEGCHFIDSDVLADRERTGFGFGLRI